MLEGTFKIKSEYAPAGDQPKAIDALVEGLNASEPAIVLMGVTGSGKTFTMANVIERVQRPTLVLAHNKTLAAQLCGEFKAIFPESAVEYFVSYYDYYQPEAYIPSSDVYIEKVSTVNDEIDKLRHSATSALNERRDVVIVASVSCIYALGDPVEYLRMSISLRPGMRIERDALMLRLVEVQYERNDYDFVRGTFRARGDVLEIFPASASENAIRVEFFGDEIERISEISALTGEVLSIRSHIAIFPASHYAVGREKLLSAMEEIEQDMFARVQELKDADKLVEAQRLQQRTIYDLEMMRELGYCSGIENYSRYFDGRTPGDPPFTLLDYFPDDFLLIIDESHVTLPQVRAMYAGDLSRKRSLVDYGFRIPSAYDNRPLKFEEFEQRVKQTIYVSATPGPYELGKTRRVVEQIIRPTGLIDPMIDLRLVKGQVDDLLGEARLMAEKGYRTLVTTLTKRMAESLTDYLDAMGIKVRYMHSDIETLERMEIIRGLRLGEFDVLVGINLLREGLDLPEVGLVAIFDADKEGFLRSTTSLIQTIGRAARNVDGRVIMYADLVTDSMKRALDETQRRREKQLEFNRVHGITPRSTVRTVGEVLAVNRPVSTDERQRSVKLDTDVEARILILEQQMQEAAMALEFEQAAVLRDQIKTLKGEKVERKKSQKRPPGRRRA